MQTFFDVFETTVARVGDRVAVEVQKTGGLDRFTYSELRALALNRAAWLAAQGIGSGDRCAILAHNDAHWCAAYLGILARGAVAVPLDTSYAAAQVATIVSDSGTRVVFVDERLADVARDALVGLPDVVLRGIREDGAAVGDAGAAGGDAGAEAPALQGAGTSVPASPSPAVILYTSGTTSDPKGVVLTHANLIAERDAAFAIIDVSDQDSVLGVLPLFHSLAQLANLLLPFAVGARVVFLETPGSQELVRALAERQITIFACVPQFFYLIHERVTHDLSTRGLVARTTFRALLGTAFRMRRLGINLGPWLFSRVHREMGPQMRLFVTGGSRFDPAMGREFYALGFTILQAYGLTETSGAATISLPDDVHLDTVGRPLPGVAIRILPAGTPESADASDAGHADGEVAVRGPIVMQGYYNRPDATAGVMQDGWLLTGDLGRLDAAGRLTITGRKTDVIVLANGKNIYPEEIEAHYRQSAYIKEMCVTTASGNGGGERLYAVVVPDMALLRERKIVNAGDILRFEIEGLGGSLPSYKRVLGYQISFEPLPRTTTGKVKRHEIERRLRERTAPTDATEATDTDRAWLDDAHVAAAVAVVRARVASGAPLRSGSNLELDLGLDSMKRVELVTDLEQRFGVNVPDETSHQIFTLAQLIDAVRPPAGSAPSAITAQPDDAWAVLLRRLPPATDPLLSGLLDRRPILGPLLFLAGRMLSRALARIDVSGLERLPRDGAFIISPNHQSYLDPFVVCGVLPYRVFAKLFFVGAIEYFETSLMAWVARKVNCVPVDPDSNLVPAMQAGAFGLAHGKVLMLFPEGERSMDGAVKHFKKGAVILSRHARVPVVPVALKGAHEIWPRGRSFNWRTLRPWSRCRVRLEFGTPLEPADGESDQEAATRLRAVVDEMWQGL